MWFDRLCWYARPSRFIVFFSDPLACSIALSSPSITCVVRRLSSPMASETCRQAGRGWGWGWGLRRWRYRRGRQRCKRLAMLPSLPRSAHLLQPAHRAAQLVDFVVQVQGARLDVDLQLIAVRGGGGSKQGLPGAEPWPAAEWVATTVGAV